MRASLRRMNAICVASGKSMGHTSWQASGDMLPRLRPGCIHAAALALSRHIGIRSSFRSVPMAKPKPKPGPHALRRMAITITVPSSPRQRCTP